MIPTDKELLAREGWSAVDFDANRSGRLSPTQIEVIRRRMHRYVRRMLAWTIPIPLLALAAAAAMLVAKHEPALFVLPVMAFVAVLPLQLYVGMRARAVLADLAGGAVGEVTGPIAGMFLNFRTGQARVRIGNTAMQCYGPQSDRGWQEGRRYLRDQDGGGALRAYYLPRSRLFVAAEPA